MRALMSKQLDGIFHVLEKVNKSNPVNGDLYFGLERVRELDPQGRSHLDKLNNMCAAILCCAICGKRTQREQEGRCELLGTEMGKILASHQVRTRIIELNWRIIIRVLKKHNENMENYGEGRFRVLPQSRRAAKWIVELFLRWARDGFDEVIDQEEEWKLNRTLRDLNPDEGRRRLNASFLLN